MCLPMGQLQDCIFLQTTSSFAWQVSAYLWVIILQPCESCMQRAGISWLRTATEWSAFITWPKLQYGLLQECCSVSIPCAVLRP